MKLAWAAKFKAAALCAASADCVNSYSGGTVLSFSFFVTRDAGNEIQHGTGVWRTEALPWAAKLQRCMPRVPIASTLAVTV